MYKSFYGAPATAEMLGLEWLEENEISAPSTPGGNNSGVRNKNLN